MGSDSLSLSLAFFPPPLFLFLITILPFLFQLDWIYQISSGSAGILARGIWQTPIPFVLRAAFALLYTYLPSLPLPAPGKQWDLGFAAGIKLSWAITGQWMGQGP